MSDSNFSNEPSLSGVSEQIPNSDSASPPAVSSGGKCVTAVSTKGSSSGEPESNLSPSAPIDFMSPNISDDSCSSATTSQLPKNAGDINTFQGGLIDCNKMEQKESNLFDSEEKRRLVDGSPAKIELSLPPLSSSDAEIMKSRRATHPYTNVNDQSGSTTSKEGPNKRCDNVQKRTSCNDEIEEKKANEGEIGHSLPDLLNSRSARPRTRDCLESSAHKHSTMGQRLHVPSIVVDQPFSSSQIADEEISSSAVQKVLSDNPSLVISKNYKRHSSIPQEICEEPEEDDVSLLLLEHTEADGIIAISSSPLAPSKVKVTGPLPANLSPFSLQRNEGEEPTFEARRVPSRQQNGNASLTNADFPLPIAPKSFLNSCVEERVDGATANGIDSAAEDAGRNAANSSDAEVQQNLLLPSESRRQPTRNAETQTLGRHRSREPRLELRPIGVRGRRGLLGTQSTGHHREGNHASRMKRGSLTVEQKDSLQLFHTQPRMAATTPLRLLHAVILQEFLSFKQNIFSSQLFLLWKHNAYVKNHREGEIKWGQNFWVDTVPYHENRICETPHENPLRQSSWGNVNSSVNASIDHSVLWRSENSCSNINPLYFSGASVSVDDSSLPMTHKQECFETVEGFSDRGSVEIGDFGGRGKAQESLLVECGEKDIFLPQKVRTSSIPPSKKKMSFLASLAERRSTHRGESLRPLSRMDAFFLNCQHFLYRCCCLRCAIAQQTSLVFLDGERQRLVPVPFIFPKLYTHPIQYSKAVRVMTCLDAVTCGFCCPCLGYNGMGTAVFGWRLRYWVRCRYGLRGTSVNDLLAMLMCPVLGSDQIGFEIESHGIHETWSPFVSSALKELNSLYQIR